MASRRYLPILTSRDRAQIKRVARELADMGERDPETVMLSGGYAEVFPSHGATARVKRRGKITNVRLTATPRRKNPSKKRPSARACSSRGHTLRVAGTSRSGKALRQCRRNPSDGYVVKVTGRRPYHASSYNDALWHAKRSTATTNSRVKAVLYQGDKAVWLMTGGQVVTFYR